MYSLSPSYSLSLFFSLFLPLSLSHSLSLSFFLSVPSLFFFLPLSLLLSLSTLSISLSLSSISFCLSYYLNFTPSHTILLYHYTSLRELQRRQQEKEKLSNERATLRGKLEIYEEKFQDLSAKLNSVNYR